MQIDKPLSLDKKLPYRMGSAFFLYAELIIILGGLFLSSCATTHEFVSPKDLQPATDFLEADFSSFVDLNKVEMLDKKSALDYIKNFEPLNIRTNQIYAFGSIITGIEANETGIHILAKYEPLENEKVKFYWVSPEGALPKLLPYNRLGLIIGRSKNRTKSFVSDMEFFTPIGPKIREINAKGDLRSPFVLYIGELDESGTGFTEYWFSVNFNGKEYQHFQNHFGETYGYVHTLADMPLRRSLDMTTEEYNSFLGEIKKRLKLMSDVQNGIRLAEALVALGAHQIVPPGIPKAESLIQDCETWRQDYQEAMENCRKSCGVIMFKIHFNCTLYCSPLLPSGPIPFPAINIPFREDCSLDSEGGL
ncbi:hypothetical protein UR09_06225 [Candidatus Nitromaritima sp. SCGC AAA799-A02]|nr:hypothetical protein UR09_06225 [Candidatus Nitromaritima sp. SCGC AAA799-A02]